MGISPGVITQPLADMKDGNRDAEATLVPRVYLQVPRLAAHHTRSERPRHSLQATALVHEAYLRLTGQKNASWQNRACSYVGAGQVMRNILVGPARQASGVDVSTGL